MFELPNIKTHRNWISYFIILVIFEVIFFGLFAYNKIYFFVLISAVILSVIYFYSLVVKPFLWLILIIVGSFLENWGHVGGGVTVFHIAWANSFFAGIIYYLYKHNYPFNFNIPFGKYVFLYVGFAAFSLIYSPNTESALSFLATTVALYFLTIWIANFLRADKEFNWVIITLLICNIFLTGLIFYQILTFDPWKIVDVAISATGEKILRPSGTFADPNVAAAHIVVGVLYGLSLFFYSNTKRLFKIYLFLAVSISLFGIVLTFSRTVWVSLVFGFGTILFFQSRKNILIIFSSFSLLVLIFVLFTPYGSFITERVYSIFDIMGDVSIRTRISLIISGFHMFIDNPVLGVGYRAFPIYYDHYIDPLAPQILLYVKESHTLIITLLAELGIAGVLIVVLWFRRIIIDIISTLQINKSPIYKALLIGSLANIITFLVYSFFYGNIFPHFNFLWLIFGIVYSIYFAHQKNRTDFSESKH